MASRAKSSQSKLDQVCIEIFNESTPETCQTLKEGCLLFCVANWDKIKPLFFAQLKYAQDEDMHPHVFWDAQTKLPSKRRAK